MWVNPLDKVPQIRQDYANHMLYAAFLWFILAVMFGPNASLVMVFIIGAAKKVVDYYKEDETVFVCVSKTIVTGLGGLIPWLGYVWGKYAAFWHLFHL